MVMSFECEKKMDDSLYVFELENWQPENSKEVSLSLGLESKEFSNSNTNIRSEKVDWNQLVDEVFR